MNDLSAFDGRNTPPPPAPLTPAEIRAFLDFQMEQLLARRADILAILADMREAYPTIDDDDALGIVAENMRMAHALTRSAEDRRKGEKEPFLSGGRAVDAWFKRFQEPLDTACQPVQAAMNAYGTRIEAERRAQAVEAQRLAEQAAAQAAAEAADLLARATPPVEQELNQKFDRAAEAAQAAELAGEQANARPAAFTRTVGDYGAVTSMRSSWAWEVENIDLVPRAYMMINADAIKAAGKPRDAQGKPLAVIAGIKWTRSLKMGVR